jgi:hypothetical protein
MYIFYDYLRRHLSLIKQKTDFIQQQTKLLKKFNKKKYLCI